MNLTALLRLPLCLLAAGFLSSCVFDGVYPGGTIGAEVYSGKAIAGESGVPSDAVPVSARSYPSRSSPAVGYSNSYDSDPGPVSITSSACSVCGHSPCQCSSHRHSDSNAHGHSHSHSNSDSDSDGHGSSRHSHRHDDNHHDSSSKITLTGGSDGDHPRRPEGSHSRDWYEDRGYDLHKYDYKDEDGHKHRKH